ncbi:hypothetical protein NBRGN_064_00130 [Nocardia brasiliensis NBRC 14402]|uniref:hypothetical protein n=1 Tax=Nocardia brasiliensis TaxID=37326 RepID=UPI0002F6F208|nr:hypothetical protein [Nocardia brasiliensis]GAJ83556.1 hypothetical protein NBRGN_064_00130 [Nocardia brasiliensis NBRC 14402]SUB53799.1 Uncharacterised protein [Nocardia brasiliensis]
MAFDDDVFQNTLHRIRERAPHAVSGLVDGVLRLISGVIGVVMVTGVLGVLHPILVPLLVIALVPTWCAPYAGPGWATRCMPRPAAPNAGWRP